MKTRLTVGTAELETFLVIAELGSFSRAAERLSLAQPSISNRIQRLERAFQTRLFERTTRAVVLTPAGQRLRDRVKPIISDLQSLIAEFRSEAEVRRHTIVIATTPMLAALVLPPIIRRFEQANPSIIVQLHDRATSLGALIRSGQLDMAFVARPPPMEGVVFDLVSTNSFMVVGPADHPALASRHITPEQLVRHPLLVLSAYMFCIDELTQHFQGNVLVPPPVRTVQNVSTLLGLVSAGLGLTLLPQVILHAGGAIDDSRFRTAVLDGLAITRDYGIASLVGHDWSPGARAFASTLKAELPRLRDVTQPGFRPDQGPADPPGHHAIEPARSMDQDARRTTNRGS